MTITLLSDQIAHQDALEWLGLITGVLYVILATYERPSCWIFGILSSACIAWKSFTDYRLMADVTLQVFYIVIGVLGLWQWASVRTKEMKKPITISPGFLHLISVAISMVLSWPLSWLLIRYADARYGYMDTLLTLLSVWATFLLIRKDLHNWLYWLCIDIVYVYLYWRSEGYLFALLFLIYTLISVWGWKQWEKNYKVQGLEAG